MHCVACPKHPVNRVIKLKVLSQKGYVFCLGFFVLLTGSGFQSPSRLTYTQIMVDHLPSAPPHHVPFYWGAEMIQFKFLSFHAKIMHFWIQSTP